MYLIINEDLFMYMLGRITKDERDACMNGYISIVDMDAKLIMNRDGKWTAIEVAY